VRLKAGDKLACDVRNSLNGTKWNWEFRPNKLNNDEAD
jgi:hypothetical protein